MRRWMGMISRMTASPLAYPAIMMANTYANAGDEKGKKLDVPQSRVGIGDRGLCFFYCTGSGRFQFPPLNFPIPHGILFMYPLSLGNPYLPSPVRAGHRQKGIHLQVLCLRPGMRPMPGLLC